MDPIGSAAVPATNTPATASANSASSQDADFQAAFDQVLSAVGAGALSVVLEELIQIGAAEDN